MNRQLDACERCRRPVLFGGPRCVDCRKETAVRATVEHAYYGCDTGCCGHEVLGFDAEGDEVFRRFDFDHPGCDDPKTWATSLADQYLRGVPLDWENCNVLDD